MRASAAGPAGSHCRASAAQAIAWRALGLGTPSCRACFGCAAESRWLQVDAPLHTHTAPRTSWGSCSACSPVSPPCNSLQFRDVRLELGLRLRKRQLSVMKHACAMHDLTLQRHASRCRLRKAWQTLEVTLVRLQYVWASLHLIDVRLEQWRDKKMLPCNIAI